MISDNTNSKNVNIYVFKGTKVILPKVLIKAKIPLDVALVKHAEYFV